MKISSVRYNAVTRGLHLWMVFLGLPTGLFSAEPAPLKLQAAWADKAPLLDGKSDDEAWKKATPLDLEVIRVMEPNKGLKSKATLRALYTETHIHFLVTWEDEAESVSHKTWIWNGEKKAYETGTDREDMCSLAFEHTGAFNGDMLSGEEGVWDVWHWKASRTNPQGYAMDKTHRYSREKPDGKAKQYEGRNGKAIWIARPEDKGDSAEKSQAAPTEHKGDQAPQYVPTTPTGSAADVKAKGAWANGKWTLEFSRSLKTGNDDDTVFDTAKTYRFGLAVFDMTGDMDKASGVIELSFAKP